MAHRNFDFSQTLGKHVKVIAGSFAPNGASAISAASNKGKGWSVARTGVGKYVLTLEDSYVDCVSAMLKLQLATGDDKYLQWNGAIDVASKTATILVQDKSSSDAYETSTVVCVAETSAFEVGKALFANFAGSAQGDYFAWTSVAGTKYAAWIDKDANGTAPTGAVYVAADQKFKIPATTGDTAADIAAKAIIAIGTLTNQTVTNNNDGSLSIAQTKIGNVTNIAAHNTGDSGAGSITCSVVTGGASSNLGNKYFVINSANDITSYYVWFNVNGEGVDPAVAGKTAIPIAIASGAANTAVGTAVKNAIDALADFDASLATATVTITNTAYGVTTDIADTGSTGLTIATTLQGDSAQKDISANANNRVNFQLILKNSVA